MDFVGGDVVQGCRLGWGVTYIEKLGLACTLSEDLCTQEEDIVELCICGPDDENRRFWHIDIGSRTTLQAFSLSWNGGKFKVDAYQTSRDG